MTDEERAKQHFEHILNLADIGRLEDGQLIEAAVSFAAAVRADATKLEREACAKVADDVADDWERSEGAMGGYHAGKECADKIRARKL